MDNQPQPTPVILMLPPNVLIAIDDYMAKYQHNFGVFSNFIPKISNKNQLNYFVIIN